MDEGRKLRLDLGRPGQADHQRRRAGRKPQKARSHPSEGGLQGQHHLLAAQELAAGDGVLHLDLVGLGLGEPRPLGDEIQLLVVAAPFRLVAGGQRPQMADIADAAEINVPLAAAAVGDDPPRRQIPHLPV